MHQIYRISPKGSSISPTYPISRLSLLCARLSELSVIVHLALVKIRLKTLGKRPDRRVGLPTCNPKLNLLGGKIALGKCTPLVTRQGHTLYALRPQKVAGKVGVEPTTSLLTTRHSTVELPTQNPQPSRVVG